VQIAERLAMALTIPLDDRADFVRRARAIRPEQEEVPTPPPSLEEIGSEDLTGRAIRGYALSEKIGSGGMGAVYRATQPLVEREVAIKIILPSYANHPDFIRRFEAEAQLVARLEHPHIVPLYDYWREPHVAFLVMRLLRGGSMQGLLEEGALPVASVARMLEQIGSALIAAHRIGVIHRDLKPANILLDENQNAYLADFGIAKNLGNPEVSEQTRAGAVIGSPKYMSPEQIRSLSVRPQSDIYCLGVMLYEMLTGKAPFVGPTPIDFIQQHISAPMPALSANRTGLPVSLDAIIARATAKEPEKRHSDVSEFLLEFHQAMSGLIARPVSISDEDEVAVGEVTNPYKGLRAFSEADAEDFFGRETLIQQLLARSVRRDLSRFWQ
jgi:serine/threonine-protein kinase